MILCVPFLASDPAQFDPRWLDAGLGVEAALFDRHDVVDADTWDRVRSAVRRISRFDRPPAFMLHFPVNDCDYLADPVIRQRLYAAVDLVDECGMTGLVLHSNRIRRLDEWHRLDIAQERARFTEFVAELGSRVADGPFWIGLENMPLTGNDGDEVDPLLIYPADFSGLTGGNIGVTLDFCHYSYTVHVSGLMADGVHPDASCYPNAHDADFLDFLELAESIVHYHFSAFRGVATKNGEMCVEGVPPWRSTVSEDVYARALRAMAGTKRATTMTLEIAEADYRNRSTVFDVVTWCRDVLGQNGGAA